MVMLKEISIKHVKYVVRKDELEKKKYLEEIFKKTHSKYSFSHRNFILENQSLIWNPYA